MNYFTKTSKSKLATLCINSPKQIQTPPVRFLGLLSSRYRQSQEQNGPARCHQVKCFPYSAMLVFLSCQGLRRGRFPRTKQQDYTVSSCHMFNHCWIKSSTISGHLTQQARQFSFFSFQNGIFIDPMEDALEKGKTIKHVDIKKLYIRCFSRFLEINTLSEKTLLLCCPCLCFLLNYNL